jgi:tRNA pseudouridine32 synthase/23S rRNA pseudouridine746 synthase
MTAGLMIIAHRKKLVQEFTELFTQRAIEKVYYAVCNGQPGASHFTMNEPLDDRPAETTAWFISSDPGRDQALLRLQLKTGRKHQIRRHLAMAGHTIVGDRLYGENASQEDLQLVAASLAFSSPLDGHEVSYELPEEVLSSSLIMSVNKSGC